MGFDYDVIVVGSGFGGSVMSCRLTEQGHKVCLLERGQEYPMHSFPRRLHDVKNKMFWDPKDNKFGYMEIRNTPESDLMSVTASGLGGGSLIYANVLLPMPAEYFEWWPKPYTRELLDPYYQKVIDTMEASPYPINRPFYSETTKTKRYRELASQLPKDNFTENGPDLLEPDLAIRFEGEFPGQQMKNKHGAIQSSCTKCGECDVGCNIHAKNTLDLNYIFRAKNWKDNPLEIKTRAEVFDIDALDEGYRIHYRNPEDHEETKIITAKKVVLSMGAVHSPAMLLKWKKYGKLPKLSDRLGEKWCGNGDLLGFAIDCDKDMEPTNGPVITTALRYQFKSYPDGYPSALYLEDAGVPIGIAWYLAGKMPSPDSALETVKVTVSFLKNYVVKALGFKDENEEINLGDDFAKMLDKDTELQKILILLGMGKDRNSGKIKLRESDDEILVEWDIEPSRIHFDRTRKQMAHVAKALGGTFINNPLTHLDKIIAVHPLGGCTMGFSPEDSVVNTKGEVFGYDGLYVVDGSILPTSVGPNPSLSIAAVAEYIAQEWKND